MKFPPDGPWVVLKGLMLQMSKPRTREEFKQNCLRRLGWPILEVNVDEDQVDDRIDEALVYYADYHFDATEKIYYRAQVTANTRGGAIHSLTLVSGGTAYSNTDTLVFTGGGGSGATGTLTTYANGTISSVTLTSNGSKYGSEPTVMIQTSTGSGASVTSLLGGFFQLPENIIGAVKIFSLGSVYNSGNFFDIRYQLALNDLHTLTSTSLVPYYMAFQHIQLIEQLLVGEQPIRYNRHRNRLHIDMNWDRLNNAQYIIIEAYQVVDPDEFTDVWNDRWLLRYCTALIKRQWGTNMKKFTGMTLPNGIQFNGQQIYDEAIEEIEKLENEVLNSYSLPISDMIGIWIYCLLTYQLLQCFSSSTMM